ncbi:MAG: Mu-like prophage major head subunit gpT family protein [Bacteroidetes bacterium]|nr:Mu-like prophage major head subunit gpT family protein [Bacteroidota bacterium]
MKSIPTNAHHIRAAIVSNSFNKENRTVEVVFATETPVARYSWDLGTYSEILEISKNAIDFSRLKAGAPVLNAHSSYSLNGIIGVVEDAWIDEQKREACARLRFSNREDIQPIIDDIEAGIIRNVSAGYFVDEYQENTKEKTYRATKWTPAEISFVPVPADHNSGVRDSQNLHLTTIINDNLMDTQERATETPANNPAQSASAVAPATTLDEQFVRSSAVQEERNRVAAITDACQRAGLPAEFSNKLISEGTSLDNARAAIIDKIAENANKPPVTQNARVSGADEETQTRNAIVEGLMERSNPGSVDLKGNEKARRYANMRMLDLAKDRLRAKGENFDLLSEQEIIRRAWATTDYPTLLTSTFDRSLRRFYEGSVNEWKWIARRESANDFREKTGITVDGAVTFEEIPEGGVYRETPVLMHEDQKIKLRKYGRKYSITDIALINDDLGVFSRMPQILALGAQQFQSEAVWALITSNAKAPDGTALFHASHKNLGTAAVLSEASLSAGRTAMRRQTSPAGHRLGVRPKYLLVPPELETAAEKIVSAVLANTTGDVNVFANKLQVVVSDALTDPKAWYLVADPATSVIDGLVYAYLNGQEGLKTESRINWETDALEVKGSLAFATAVWGYQGWYKNPGA